MSDLVFDIGMHNGDDTAYYLAREYRVVAVDANPVMCAMARQRFSREISAGQLSVRNVGIAETQGELAFWVSSITEWSSFDFEWATTGGSRGPGARTATATSVKVETLPFRQLIEEEGTPFYAKIDIEGNDSICLKDLAATGSRPAYLSFEWQFHSDADIELLESLHYTSFKCVRQNDHHEITPRTVVYQEELRRLRMDLEWLPRIGIRRALRQLQYRRRPINGWTFNTGSSGPLGAELPGRWLASNEILSVWHYLMAYHLRLPADEALNEWYDIHAAHQRVKPPEPSSSPRGWAAG